MEFLTIFGIALSLAMDAFSVCVVAGVKIGTPTLRHYFRLSFHFGLFQFLMPILGYYGGVMIESIISRYGHWIALIILSFIGAKMLWESFKDTDKNDSLSFVDPSRGMTLVMLSIATSIDAAAIGFSVAALSIPILKPAIIIGIVCAVCSAVGLFLGTIIGLKIGAWAERLGGVVLIAIGIKIVSER
ncbi:MAG: manganese efflux pump [Chitinispirillaceae bacterium]|nr:manganese efflux pump [Chitinispirillaceae bacterium]